MRTTSRGLVVWDLPTDAFSHSQLAANWDLVDSIVATPASSIETVASLPATGNFAGRIVMLSAANGGYPAWTMVRYDGSNWRPVNQMEIQATVPATGNFAGRVVILSAANGGFDAWSIIRYDGSTWQLVGGWNSVNTGAGALNMAGLQTTGDVYISSSTRGFILKDRATGQTYRLYFTNGNFAYETVT